MTNIPEERKREARGQRHSHGENVEKYWHPNETVMPSCSIGSAAYHNRERMERNDKLIEGSRNDVSYQMLISG